MLNFTIKVKEKFISGSEIIKKRRIEKYVLMDLVRKGLEPWHPVNLQPIRKKIGKVYSCVIDDSYYFPEKCIEHTKTLPYAFYSIEELYPFLEECLFKAEDLAKIFPVNKTPRNGRLSETHKNAVRKIAKKMWEKDASITIQSIINSNEVETATEHNSYDEKTLRKWVKDLAPNRNPGRRPNKQ